MVCLSYRWLSILALLFLSLPALGQEASPAPPKPLPEVAALHRQALAAREAKQEAETLKLLEAMLEKAISLHDRAGEAIALQETGVFYFRKSDVPRALSCFEKALPIVQEIRDTGSEAAVLQRIGRLYALSGQIQKGISFLEQSIARFQQAQDGESEADTWDKLATLYDESGQVDKALEGYEKALAGFQKLKILRGEAVVLNNLGVHYRERNLPDKAQAYFEQLLTLARTMKDKPWEAGALRGLSGVLLRQDQTKEALVTMERRAAIHRELKEAGLEAEAVNDQANLYMYLGQWQQALTAAEKARSLFRSVQDRAGEGGTLTNSGNIYYRLGQETKARDFYLQSLPLLRSSGNRRYEAATLLGLGVVSLDLGRIEDARRYNEQALKLYRELKDRAREATALTNLGSIYNQLGQKEKALQTWEETLPLYEEANNPRNEANARTNIGNYYAAKGQYTRAQAYYEQALALSTTLEDAEGTVRALYNLGKNHLDLRRPEEALLNLRQALQMLERQRDSIGGLIDLKVSFLAAHRNACYDATMDILLLQQQGEEAFALLQKTKSRALLDLMAGGKVHLDGRLKEEERRRERELRRQCDRLNVAMVAESINNEVGSKRRYEALKVELRQAQDALHIYQNELYLRYPSLERRWMTKTATLAEVARFLPEDTALLEYTLMYASIGGKKVFAPKLFVVTAPGGKAQVTVYSLPISSVELTRKVAAFRAACANPRLPYRTLSRALYRKLIAPAEKQLKGKKRLVICPDGLLWDVPFQALRSPRPGHLSGKKRGSEFLAARFEVVMAYSATGAQAVRRARQVKPTRTLLALANPAYGDARRFGGNPAIPRQRPFDTPSRPFDTPSRPFDTPSRPLDSPSRDFFQQKRGGIISLPGTQKEVNALKQLFPDADIYTRKQAQESIIEKRGARYRYIHLASHAFFNDAAPMYSSILLAVPPRGSEKDGFLTARELFDLDFTAEMVVLSACNTARGGNQNGEGLIGLTWALFAAGVPTQVLSQWSVDDAATAELMTRFYTYLKAGLTKGAALRKAEISLLQGDRQFRVNKRSWQHPYYWAPFVLMGDWR